MWKAYLKHRTEAHSLAAQTQAPPKDVPGKARPALRVATPASPFELDATFAVVESEVPTGTATSKAFVLAEVTQGANRIRGPISVVYYSTEPEEFNGRKVFVRNGISEADITSGRFRFVETGVIKHLDDVGQRVSMDKGTSLRDVYAGSTTSRPRAARNAPPTSPARASAPHTTSSRGTPSTGRRPAAHSHEQQGGKTKRRRRASSSPKGKDKD